MSNLDFLICSQGNGVGGGDCKGKRFIYFIDATTTKVNSECYLNPLENGLWPDWRKLYPYDDYVFQQGGATSHTSRLTQNYLEEFTPPFLKKDEWLQQFPDLNAMDY